MVRVHDVKAMKAVVEVADEIAQGALRTPRLPSLAPRAIVGPALDHVILRIGVPHTEHGSPSRP